ncbi:MAG TPA: glycogen debranching protein GlgX [Methylibium sp.]|uniref:glycogen debranching protein GlgX n=1 Tax=Methylibium sp. TaxID=2067992 RepID=UPI002DB77205|nr:glycogen debranching protein GlgX [Methylibium sp.]HEU4460840.1 glycogen debranching protein GlgX [Methylibium sp.]
MTRLLRSLRGLWWSPSSRAPLLEAPTRSRPEAEGPEPAGLDLQPGRPWPLGASVDAQGVNFAVASSHAQSIELCVFDDAGREELARAALPGRSGDVFHGHLHGARPGLVYGLRAHGPWRPDKGHLFNPAKLLLDPYAREIVGRFEWHDEHFAHDRQHPRQPDARDNAATALKARVIDDPLPAAPPPRRPARTLAETVIYELHVKGYSKLNGLIPEPLRGTYAGLGHPASIEHLRALGITAVSLLPVHQRLDEERLHLQGLSNYWGYNTIGFFAPDPRLAAAHDGQAVRNEFRAMVDALHEAGLEVILDVVFNHSAEAGMDGPSLSFKGLDNATYYRGRHHWRDGHENWSGCGNTFDVSQPRVLQLVMDSLRYWVAEMRVDGFRFDLAPVLGRNEQGAFDRRAAFFTALAQDPVLAGAKLIAEPWDLGPHGYQLGAFPNGWAEWNDRFRDEARSFWLRHKSTRGAFAQRLCGSSDVFQPRGRLPAESIHYVVSHDGFTLADLLSYEHKLNHANGENNRDGHAHNLGFNAGVEGPSADPAVLALRARLARALIATTVLAQGTPMLCAGDELGHTQHGNNNPYCQDGPTTWIDWAAADEDLIAYTRRVIALRRLARPFADAWYHGVADARGLHDLAWLDVDGEPLHGHAWQDGHRRAFGCLIGQPGRAQAPLLLLFNAEAEARPHRLPAGVWEVLLDSTHPRGLGAWSGQGESDLVLPAASVLLLAAAGANLRL